MKYKTILLFLLLICGVLQINAQGPLDKMKNETALTPQAAAFAKYVEFPVSLYNGLATISIPLYTIQSGDITLPISLSYHAGGIKVAEEASWVGLGWNLNANGVISRQINGKDDYSNVSSNYFDIFFPTSGHNKYNEDFTNTANVSIEDATDLNGNSIVKNYSDLQIQDIEVNGDGEPDTYLYNFGSYSGKFINTGWYDNGKGIYDFGRNNIQFIVTIPSIIAKTPDGYIYEFSVVETSRVYKNTPTITSYYLSKITSPTGKHLSFEYDTSTQDINQMTNRPEDYSAVVWLNPNSEAILQANRTHAPLLTNNKSYPVASPVYLRKIIFDEGYVDFITGSRNDMYGKRLDRIEVHYNNGTLLKKITMNNQSYFVGVSTNSVGTSANQYLSDDDPSDIHTYSYPIEFIRQRLKLTGITEQGSGTDSPLNHKFEYYEGGDYDLPYKTSYAVDYWGYYNGNLLNKGFIPSNAGFNIPTGWDAIKNYVGSDREPNEAYAKANMLKKITYPTLGSTQYEYSLNDYENSCNQIPKYTWIPLTSKPLIAIGPEVMEQTFTLTSDQDVVIKVSLFCDAAYNNNLCNGTTLIGTWNGGDRMLDGGPYNADGYPTHSLYAQLDFQDPVTKQFNPSSNYFIWSLKDILPCNSSNTNSSGYFEKKVTLQAGTYRMVANYPVNKPGGGEYGSRMAEIEVGYANGSMNVTYAPKVGGGLRVTKITHHDPYTNNELSRSFHYSGGIMMHFPSFACSQLMAGDDASVNPGGGYENTESVYRNDCLYSNPVTPYSTSANGNAVGYSNVTEITDGGQSGKMEYQFENRNDNFNERTINDFFELLPPIDQNAFAPGVPSTPHLKNGFLKQTISYVNKITNNKDNFLPVKIAINTPVVLLPMTFWSFRGSERWVSGDYDNGGDRNNLWFMYFFYPVQIGKVVPAITSEQYFINGVPAYNNMHLYFYNSQGLLQTEKVTNSNGKVSSTDYKYSGDYNTSISWINDLNQKNMIGVPLETISKVDNLVVGGTFVQYKTHDGLTTPNNVYSIETNVPKAIGSTAPTATIPADFHFDGTLEYDANGNIFYEKRTDNVPICYVWGYNNAFPIAKIVNADYTQVSTALGGITNINSFNSNYKLPSIAQVQSFLAPLFTDATLKMNAMTSTYTYDPLKGLTSSTNPQGVTTNYNYDTFNRLWYVTNDDKSILSRYLYAYQNSPVNGVGGYAPLSDISISTDLLNYPINGLGTFTISISGGSGNYAYNWSLKYSDGSLLQTSNSNVFSFKCVKSGKLTVQCVVTDNISGLSVTSTPKTVNCYPAPTAIVTTNAASYIQNANGTATVTASNGSGNYTFSWSLNGIVLQNGTSTSFNFVCPKTDLLTVQCLVTDITSGLTATAIQKVVCYAVPTATIYTDATSYYYGAMANFSLQVSGGTGNFSYVWSLISSSGYTQSSTPTTSTRYSYSCCTPGTLTIQCVVTDNQLSRTCTALTSVYNDTTSCSLTMKPGFSLVSNDFLKYGSNTTFFIKFSPNSAMQLGTIYTIANISAECRPSAAKSFSDTIGGRICTITVNPSGDISFLITNGSVFTSGSTIYTGKLNYSM